MCTRIRDPRTDWLLGVRSVVRSGSGVCDELLPCLSFDSSINYLEFICGAEALPKYRCN